MKMNKIAGFGVAVASLVAFAGTSQVKAADVGTTMNANSYTVVTVTTGALVLAPSLLELQDGTGIMEDLDAIRLKVTSNNSTGCKVTVSAAATGDRSLAVDDIQLKSTLGVPGAGGFTSYKSLAVTTGTASTDPTFYSTSAAEVEDTEIIIDLKLKDLKMYPAIAGAMTPYTNTITFTAVANS